jgi:small nuclear ribonucleoprotein (snRNP)-like protein
MEYRDTLQYFLGKIILIETERNKVHIGRMKSYDKDFILLEPYVSCGDINYFKEIESKGKNPRKNLGRRFISSLEEITS